ncbi:MAG: hypothetical protein K8I03_01015 [Ignavibacteria bacterium]|nr:hypothetical protein [Ignavibacteria bacterium]
MRIEQKKTIKVDELAEFVPRKAGATWSALWQIFYYTRLFKYVHKKHYPKIKKSFDKICTHDKLQKMCSLGYLRSPQRDIYCATDKVLPILRETGFKTEILPSQPIGKGDINELNNTDIFVKLTKLEHFYALVYPNFGYIIPDALMIQLDSKSKKYKLTFIEVEAQKPNWSEYVEKKRENYHKLSRDIRVFEYWKNICEKLTIKPPDIKDLSFTVSFYGSIKKDFGIGFTFENI